MTWNYLLLAHLLSGCWTVLGRAANDADLLADLFVSALRFWPARPAYIVLHGTDEEDVAALAVSVASSRGADWKVGSAGVDRLGEVVEGADDDDDVVLVRVASEDGRAAFAEAARAGALVPEGRSALWLLPHEMLDPREIRTRFDSDVFLYNVSSFSSSDGRATWHEAFSVKGEHRFVSELGTWTRLGGLRVPTPNVWERRQWFLRGVPLRGVLLPWPPYTYAEADGSGDLVTRGIIPEAVHLFQASILLGTIR